ncbi:MAG: TonB-dependent receptor, partial [Sulfurimonadaceae bacterium]|nr:TonB-dependent receptor [Sulfurimonadaceae bacterium]
GYLNVFGSYTADIKAGVKYDAFASQSKLLPDGYELPSLSDPIGTKTTYPNGFYGIHESKQRTLYQSSFLKYHGLDKHTISIGYRIAIEETYDVTTITTDRDSGTGLFDYSQVYPFFNENAKRETYTFSLQDHYEFNDALSFMYGITIEKTSLSDAQFDPRISMVYQTDPQNIYKASYSSSHRNASWQEMYTVNNLARVGNPSISPEEVDAFELAYIRKFSSDSYLQADVFFLSNKDQIDKTNTQNEYRNAVDTDIYGLELEYKGNITQNDRLYLNYSFVNGKDNNDASLSNVAKHLAKGYYIYDVTPNISLSGITKYVGEKGRLSYDARSKVDDYLTFDAALRYENTRNEYAVTLSIKNMFDSEVIFPSEPMTYVGDYPQEGRTGMIIFTKAF